MGEEYLNSQPDAQPDEHASLSETSSAASAASLSDASSAASANSHLTHIDEKGAARMVDVGAKLETDRVAIAEGFIAMAPTTLAMIVEGQAP
jgi:hypothetical protein